MSLGKQLREAREKMNLTPSQVAAGTRMKIQLVEAIEAEDFTRMAAPIYGKGFIRLYAEHVGLDPVPLVNEYVLRHVNPPDSAPPSSQPLVSSVLQKEPEEEDVPKKEERKPPHEPVATKNTSPSVPVAPVEREPSTPEPTQVQTRPIEAPTEENDLPKDDLFSFTDTKPEEPSPSPSPQEDRRISPETDLLSVAAKLKENLSSIKSAETESMPQEAEASLTDERKEATTNGLKPLSEMSRMSEVVDDTEKDVQTTEPERELDAPEMAKKETDTATKSNLFSTVAKAWQKQREHFTGISLTKSPAGIISLFIGILLIVVFLISGISRWVSPNRADELHPADDTGEKLHIDVELPAPYIRKP